MLSQKTAGAYWNCHQQIINAEKLLEQTKGYIQKYSDRFSDHKGLVDAFGSMRNTLQLGIPSGDNGSHILNVDPELAIIIIEAQILKYKSQLAAINALAGVECITNQGEGDERSVATVAESETNS